MQTIPNLKAMVRNANSDTFFLIKTLAALAGVRSLHLILQTPYYRVNYQKYVIGINGSRCYGVIDHVDLPKRHSLVARALPILKKQVATKDRQIIKDMLKLCEYYQKGLRILDRARLMKPLENYLQHSHQLRVRIRQRQYNRSLLN